jgi:hypothetical protein
LFLLPLRPSCRALSAASCSYATVPGSGRTAGVPETPGEAASAELASAVLRTAARTNFVCSLMALISRRVLGKLSAESFFAKGVNSDVRPVILSFTGARSLFWAKDSSRIGLAVLGTTKKSWPHPVKVRWQTGGESVRLVENLEAPMAARPDSQQAAIAA